MNDAFMLFSFYGAKFFLLFGHEIIIVPLIIVGFMMGKREDFGSAVYLLLFTMIFNAVLKEIFQIPLASHLGKVGFAFPSGHMQSSVVFYGWLAYKASSLSVRGLIIILLAGCGTSLVYFGYHTWWDVFGAAGFSVFTLIVYGQFLCHLDAFNPRVIGASFFGVSTILLGYLWYQREILPHIWMAYYALVGFFGAWGVLNIRKRLSWTHGLFGALMVFIFVCLIESTFQKFLFGWVPSYVFEMQWFLSAGSIPCAVKMVYLLERTRRK